MLDCVMKILIQSICIHHEDIKMSDYLVRGLAELKRVLTLNAKELSINDRQYYICIVNEAIDTIQRIEEELDEFRGPSER